MSHPAYQPIFKTRAFNPNPMAGNIPYEADSISNPKCVDSRVFEEFWEEQVNYCINGYDTGGIHIPGRYYYYLNFMPLSGLKGAMNPLYNDLDLEYFRLLDWVKEMHRMGIIAPKARRKGLSEKGKAVLSHGLRFVRGYRGAITAGLEAYTTGLKKKFEYGENSIRKELRLNVLKNNEKMYQTGYHVKDPIGGFVEDGYGGLLSFETMYDDPAKLEGEYFHDVICEESGQYKLLGKVIESIKPALMFGAQMNGSFLIYGTGGNILSTSRDFKDLYDNSDIYGLERFVVDGTRLFHPFFGNELYTEHVDEDTGKKFDAIPNLRDKKPYEILGVDDVKAAKEYILKKRIEYSKLPNKDKLKKHNQNFPLTVEEMFTSGGSNNFNDEKIYAKLFEIEGKTNNYKKIVLEWVRESLNDGEGYKNVKARPWTTKDPEWKAIHIIQEPRKDILDLDIGGIDSYNQDQTKTSSSLGAMVVLRQGNRVNMIQDGIHNAEYPVCVYYNRPPRKEEFYDMCLKISTWYGLKRNTMCSAEQDFIIDHYKKHGGTKYLSVRPKTFDAKRGQQVHKYGAKVTGYSKEIILGIVQSWVEDFVNHCEFPELLRDLLAYDEEYVGTDWDVVDALAYAKMRIEDMRTRPRRSWEDEDAEPEVEWKEDDSGNMIMMSSNSNSGKKERLPNKESRDQWRSMN